MVPTNHTQLAPSKIPNAGRGLFLTKSVKAGELIFNIPRPRLAIVSSKLIESVCDECFRYEGPSGRNFVPSETDLEPTDGDDGEERTSEKLLKCEGCEAVWYCCSACKTKAFNEHHRYECDSYKAIADDEASTDPRYRSIRSHAVRSLVRLVALRSHKQISENEFQLYVKLSKGNRAITEKQESMLTNLMLKLDIFEDLEMELVERLYVAAANNECQLATPNLLTTSELDDKDSWYAVRSTDLGYCLDPYFSMMNHSCLPNATWIFDGRELQVRAEKDSNAGEEVTISYAPADTFHERKEDLEHWGIECLCKLCKKGPFEPAGRVREQIDRTLSNTHFEFGEFPDSYMTEIVILMQKMRDNGHGWGTWPMRRLHQKLYRMFKRQGDLNGTLMILLKLRYEVEELQVPKTYMSQRIDTMRLLLAVMGIIHRSRNGSVWVTGSHDLCLREKRKDEDEEANEDRKNEEEKEKDEKINIKALVEEVYVGMWVQMLSEIETCYGSTSSLARWERMRYQQEILPLGLPDIQVFESRSLKRLLAWAGINTRSGKGTSGMVAAMMQALGLNG